MCFDFNNTRDQLWPLASSCSGDDAAANSVHLPSLFARRQTYRERRDLSSNAANAVSPRRHTLELVRCVSPQPTRCPGGVWRQIYVLKAATGLYLRGRAAETNRGITLRSSAAAPPGEQRTLAARGTQCGLYVTYTAYSWPSESSSQS